MKKLLFLLPLFFLLMFSCEDQTEGCKSDSECGDQVCFYSACYDKDDAVLGYKTIHLIGNPNLGGIVSGESKLLKAQLVLAPTKEMRDKFKDHEEELAKILGPIPGKEINFQIFVNGNTTSTVETKKITDNLGMVESKLVAGTTNIQQLLNIEVSYNDCTDKTNCKPCQLGEKTNCIIYKNFKVTESPREKVLSFLSKEDSSGYFRAYVGTKKTIFAKILTNGHAPYADQEVNFKIEDNNSGSNASIEPITVTTNFAGIAKVELNAGDAATTYKIVADSTGTAKVILSVKVEERNGGCYDDTDCQHLYKCDDYDAAECYHSYTCDRLNKVCVFTPKPCTLDTDCPDNYECKEEKCEPKPFVCNEAELDTCRCIKDSNCPNNLSCIRHRCVEDNQTCENHSDCPNGLICRDNICTQRGRECKMDSNCYSIHKDKCPEEDSCVCEEGECINPCPNTNYIELSGGSGISCTKNSQCEENEVCFTAHNINKCIVKWNANYDFHLIEALPPTLQSILNGVGRLLGPVSDIINGDDIDWGLPGWLSWAEEALVALARPYIDEYVPDWVQNLITGLNDSIEILQEMRVKADMAFVHNEDIHSDIRGFEFWDKFYVEWNGTWTEVTPNSANDADDFQVNSSPFTGSISCQKEGNESKYILYINRHSAEFYFGRFVKAFIDNLLIPSVTNDEAHNIGEVLDMYIDCVSIGDRVLEAAREHLGEWANLLPETLITGACEIAKDTVENKIYDKLAELRFGNAENESDSFTFEGSATIKTKGETEGRKLIDGKYIGTLDVGGSRNFTADWEAQKER